MRVSKQLAIKATLVLALAGVASCSSSQEQMEDPVQTDSEGGEEVFVEDGIDSMGDGVEDGMLSDTDDSMLSEDDGMSAEDDIYTGQSVTDDMSSEGTDFTDAEFETTIDEPFDNNEQSLSFEPATSAPAAAAWDKTPVAQSFSTPKAAGKYEHAYVVQAGDTLSTIARRIYGNAGKWNKLASINSISNPHKIFPGDTIFYESTSETDDFATAFNNVSKQNYTVKAGDTLASIAQGVYGSQARWKVLWGYNWKNVNNPNKIFVGQQLSYVRMKDMQGFLAEIDADAGISPAKLVTKPATKPTKTVSEPIVEQAQPVEEIFEEVIVEEEVIADDDEFGEIIEDVVVDEDAVMDDEAVFEDFEDAMEE